MHYWWVYFGGGMIFQAAIIIWKDTRMVNAVPRFIKLLDVFAKEGMGDRTINELLADVELVNLEVYLKRGKF